MTDEPVFLTVDEVLHVHRRVVEAFGGTLELRDRGLLESAVSVPQSRFGDALLHAGVPAMAAAYLFHLCKNHPFADGNKRVALAVALVFLRRNRREINATDQELGDLVLGVADSSVSKGELTEFFEDRTQ